MFQSTHPRRTGFGNLAISGNRLLEGERAPSGASDDGPWLCEAGKSIPVTAAIADPGNPAAGPAWVTTAPLFGSIANADQLTATYTANLLSGSGLFTLSCTFDNGVGVAQTDNSVTHFTVDPSAVLATCQSNGGVMDILACTGSYTPGSDPAPTFLWAKESGPGNAIFSSPSVQSPTVQFDAEGTYTLRLTVTDRWSGAAFDVTNTIAISANLMATIDLFPATPVEGVAYPLFVSISGGTAPYNITWSANKDGGGGTPPTFIPNANVVNPQIQFAVGAGEIGLWNIVCDVE
ncbi:MAG: hypothetical protein R3330_03430, partial [Saprospiraceae bacterium]|nr:hypothetical protein [Saprospiraceae bacterium]